MYIAVSGQSGSGKSTLVPMLAEKLGIESVLEEEKHLPAYIAWIEGRGSLYDAQQQFLRRAFVLQKIVSAQGGIQERAIYENYEVAVRYYYDRNMLSRQEFDSLTSLYLGMCQETRYPDLLIHLTAPVEVLLDRRRRRRKIHDLLVVSSEVIELEKYYKSMIARWSICPVCEVDTSAIDVNGALIIMAEEAVKVARGL